MKLVVTEVKQVEPRPLGPYTLNNYDPLISYVRTQYRVTLTCSSPALWVESLLFLLRVDKANLEGTSQARLISFILIFGSK